MTRTLCTLCLLIALPEIIFAAPSPCAPNTTPALTDVQFTNSKHSPQPHNRLFYLPAETRAVFIHSKTTGPGKITWRWLHNGKRMPDVAAEMGDGTWHSWSRLRHIPAGTKDIRVQLYGAQNCLLADMRLATVDFADHPQIRKAWQQLAAEDVTGAKLTLKLLLETIPPRSALARSTQRMLDVDVALGQALARAKTGQLFLVESTLKDIQRRLGSSAADHAASNRITEITRESTRQGVLLAREGNFVALATRHLLETEKIYAGDYPLWREDAEKILKPALIHAGDTFTVIDWKPTLRGYQLLLQDKRTGKVIEVVPE